MAVSYDAPKQTADAAWVAAHVAHGAFQRAAPCAVVAYEARDDFNRFTAMEVVSSAAEMAEAAAAGAAAPFLVFPEDRSHAVRDFHRLPARWLPLASAAAASGCRPMVYSSHAAPAPRHCATAPLAMGGTVI